MEYDTERAAVKRAEIAQYARDAVVACWKANGFEYDDLKADIAAKKVLDNFVEITPPEKAPILIELITLNSLGRRGGRSVKPGNLLLDMRKLFTAIASGVMATVGVIAAPWTAVFAALLLWDRVWSSLKIDISETEAVLLWTMWKNRDLNNHIPEEGLLELVNSDLSSNGRPIISKQQFDDSLETLSNMSCIARTTSIEGKWWLCEWVSTPYT